MSVHRDSPSNFFSPAARATKQKKKIHYACQTLSLPSDKPLRAHLAGNWREYYSTPYPK
jgi:hypothetical protein